MFHFGWLELGPPEWSTYESAHSDAMFTISYMFKIILLNHVLRRSDSKGQSDAVREHWCSQPETSSRLRLEVIMHTIPSYRMYISCVYVTVRLCVLYNVYYYRTEQIENWPIMLVFLFMVFIMYSRQIHGSFHSTWRYIRARLDIAIAFIIRETKPEDTILCYYNFKCYIT